MSHNAIPRDAWQEIQWVKYEEQRVYPEPKDDEKTIDDKKKKKIDQLTGAPRDGYTPATMADYPKYLTYHQEHTTDMVLQVKDRNAQESRNQILRM